MTQAKQVRCRFAPSPTGYLHLGGARTAIFNYLYSRSHGGVHILRIEDTDRERSTQEATDAILDSMHWLNIAYDEGPFFQSERTALYQDYARKLLAAGHAYACTCTSEELAEMRERLRAEGKNPQYDRRHRPAEATEQPTELPAADNDHPFVIRLRVPESGTIVFDDLVLGRIETPLAEIDDFIIIRSDGSPTYNFTVVVDDFDMRISHVIRGMDHISNTPKQLVVYEALGAEPPAFAHVPMILGPDKKKLSKRHGATSVYDYKKEGFLPDGFVNYLVRLGWSHGDQEIFSREELEQVFSLESVNKSAAVFDPEKLQWVNAEHIKARSAGELVPLVVDHMLESGILKEVSVRSENLLADKNFLALIESLRERTKTLTEMAAQCLWYLLDDAALVLDEKARNKHLKAKVQEPLLLLTDKLEGLESFTEEAIEPVFQAVLEEHELKLLKLAQPVRVALTGGTVSPPIYSVLEVLGKERTLSRLKRAIAGIETA